MVTGLRSGVIREGQVLLVPAPAPPADIPEDRQPTGSTSAAPIMTAK